MSGLISLRHPSSGGAGVSFTGGDLDGEMPRLRFHCDPAQFSEGIDAYLAAKATVAETADAAERHLWFVMHGRAIDESARQ